MLNNVSNTKRVMGSLDIGLALTTGTPDYPFHRWIHSKTKCLCIQDDKGPVKNVACPGEECKAMALEESSVNL